MNLRKFDQQQLVLEYRKNRSKYLYGFLKNYNSQNTRDAYQRDLREFLLFLYGNFKVTEVIADHPHCVAFKEFLIEKNYSKATINRKIAVCSAYLQYLENEEIRSRRNPFIRIKRFNINNEEVKTKKIDEYFLNETLRNLRENKNDYCLFYFMFHTGLRVSEVLSIKLQDLSNENGTHYVEITLKGDRAKKINLSGNVIENIIEMLEERNTNLGNLSKNMFLFSDKNNGHTKLTRFAIYRKIKKHFGSDYSPHSARATFITSNIFKEGIMPTMRKVGHLNIQTTSKYFKE